MHRGGILEQRYGTLTPELDKLRDTLRVLLWQSSDGKHGYLPATRLADIAIGFFIKAGQSVFYQSASRSQERCKSCPLDGSMFTERADSGKFCPGWGSSANATVDPTVPPADRKQGSCGAADGQSVAPVQYPFQQLCIRSGE
jgi:hypothetical protein